jgi:hypothetical protein
VNEQISSWLTYTLSIADEACAWNDIAEYVLDEACKSEDPRVLHSQLTPLDRVLAEAAWNLWECFPDQASRTATTLQQWWSTREGSGIGRAVLILDALSLRELPLLLQACANHKVIPQDVRATAAEVPTDTDQFAKALGLPGRSSLTSDKIPASFILSSSSLFTDVLASPFADCVRMLKPRSDLVIWHSWLDDLIHLHSRDRTEVEHATQRELLSDDFWQFIDALRQGRRLIITSDHGYAVSALFATDEPQGFAKDYLVSTFSAKRNSTATGPVPHEFMPPLALSRNGEHVVLGQRRWRVASGYPQVCHGGLSLLEAFVPFVELPEVL